MAANRFALSGSVLPGLGPAGWSGGWIAGGGGGGGPADAGGKTGP